MQGSLKRTNKARDVRASVVRLVDGPRSNWQRPWKDQVAVTAIRKNTKCKKYARFQTRMEFDDFHVDDFRSNKMARAKI